MVAFFDQARSTSPLRNADLHYTVYGKSGHLTIPSSRLAPVNSHAYADAMSLAALPPGARVRQSVVSRATPQRTTPITKSLAVPVAPPTVTAPIEEEKLPMVS